ncbi:MAG: hypothetical protein K2J65_01835 [Duncaniella sp.]|nr:hypothetical protein [Duncaniella sp.]
MKKKILSISVLLASIFTISSVAQNPASQSCQSAQPCQTAQCGNNKCPDSQQCQSVFAGLNLTDKQKEEIKSLKPSKEQIHEQKLQNKAKKDAERQQRREQKQQSRKDYLSKIKAILTPEQYVQFLENNYLAQGFKSDKSKSGKNRKGNKHNNGHRHNGAKDANRQVSDKQK